MREANLHKHIDFFENGMRVKTLMDPSEIQRAYALRHEVFAEELGWVPRQENKLEIDSYDIECMVPLCVFDQTGGIIAHLRITLPHCSFMMEKEFANLIEKPISKNSGTVEVSRVCTALKFRKVTIETRYGNYYIAMLLYKGIYLWSLRNNISTMFMVVEYKLFRLLRLSGFPCHKVGLCTTMADGVVAVAVRINWEEFETKNYSKRPMLLSWYGDVGEIRKVAETYIPISPLCMATATA